MTPRLRAVGLRKAYRVRGGTLLEVLRGVDLALERGEYVAVTGSSGAGKSTLLALLGCLDRADGGELWFDDQPLARASRRALARYRGRSLGFVFQAFHLIPELTAWENVLLAARYAGLERGAAVRVAGALFERLGIADRRDHFPPELSGGEQQRVAFCRAVVKDPPLILADEPTGNLDEEHSAVILRELRARAEAGGTVLLVTHSAALAAQANRVYELEAGRLRPRVPTPRPAGGSPPPPAPRAAPELSAPPPGAVGTA